MSFGNMLLNMMSGDDPLKRLAAAGAGASPQQVGQPQDGDVPPAGAAGTPGTGAPGAAGTPPQPPEAKALQSPNDLSKMYLELLDRQQRGAAIDKGATLIAAGFARPENRSNIMSTLGRGDAGGGEGSNPAAAMQNFMKIQADLQTKQNLAKQRAVVPLIAKQYGLDPQAALYLFDSGQLDDVIKEREKPNVELVKDSNGQYIAVDKSHARQMGTFGNKAPDPTSVHPDGTGRLVTVNERSGTQVGQSLGDAKPNTSVHSDGTGQLITIDQGTGAPVGDPAGAPRPNTSVHSGGDGKLYTIDQGTGAPVGQPVGPAKPEATGDMRELDRANAERATSGQPPITMEDWLKNVRHPGTVVNVGDKEIAKGFAKTYVDEYDKAKAASDSMADIQAARSQLDKGIISGSKLSPYDLEGRKILGAIFGVPDDLTTNTDAFIASTQEVVAKKLKAYGSGASITDKDREFVQKAIGGSLELNETTIRRILDIQEKSARSEAIRYNNNIKDLVRKDPSAIASVRTVPVPDVPQEHLDKLRSNPDATHKKFFDDVYGKGAADHFLGSP